MTSLGCSKQLKVSVANVGGELIGIAGQKCTLGEDGNLSSDLVVEDG